MRRRAFLALMGGATAWPIAAHAQQEDRHKSLVGWLDGQNENEAAQALRIALRDLGWADGNLKIERRVTAGDASRLRNFAAELVSLKPNVIVAGGAEPARALQQATNTIPIVLTRGGDAAVIGLVKNINKPESNVTGFSSAEPSVAGKRLELLKEAAPNVSRVGVVFKPEIAPTSSKYIAAIETAAHNLSVEVVKLPFKDTIELVHVVDSFATTPNGGLLILPPSNPDSLTTIKLAAQHRLPAIYPGRTFVARGGLISYNSDDVDQHRRAASYVDRLLRGAKVADLPVQFPTKYLLVVNMKTAKEIEIAIPETFLLHADELIGSNN